MHILVSWGCYNEAPQARLPKKKKKNPQKFIVLILWRLKAQHQGDHRVHLWFLLSVMKEGPTLDQSPQLVFCHLLPVSPHPLPSVCESESCSFVSNSATPRTVCSMEFSRPEYWSGWPFPSPGIFPTQESNPGLPHCRQILYQLRHQRSLHFNLMTSLKISLISVTFWGTGWLGFQYMNFGRKIQKRQRNGRSNCQHLLDHRKSKRVPEKHLFLFYWLHQSLWLWG